MDSIVVYSPQTSSRLRYALDWLLTERLQLTYTITHDTAIAAALPFCISYGASLPNSLSIPDAGLLWQQGISRQGIAAGLWQDIPTLFAMGDHTFTLPFDIFSAIFFLLSRYEEYYPYTPDKHGRYPATESILYKNKWLQRPLADEWAAALGRLLYAAGTGVPPAAPALSFQPTYDIDIAYSHKYKGIRRLTGAYLKALLKLDIEQIMERTQVLKNRQRDPYDSFGWLQQLHAGCGYTPIWFVLCALKTTAYDKNIHPHRPAMKRLIKKMGKAGPLGIHPSYYSGRQDVMMREKRALEHVAGRQVHLSRQHYIKLKIPDTYYLLIKNNITEDYSMGYGACLGFRAGTAASFLWYDVAAGATSALRIHPFCFMDTTARYELHLTPAQAFKQLDSLYHSIAATGGTLITVFHNFSLGADAGWAGWRDAYEAFCRSHAPQPRAAGIS